MFNGKMTIAGFDPELAESIAGERGRQEDHIELIASDNSALLDLSMQHVSIHTHWKPSDCAFLQHPSSLLKPFFLFASSRF